MNQDWTVFVRNQDFWERLQRLEKDVAYKEAQKRGWFSYTELSCLMNSMQLITVAHALVNVSSICLATYTAGVVTLLGSALVASYLPGTVLSPRQTATDSPNAMQADLNPVVDVTQENILTTDFIPTSLNCNQSQEFCKSMEQNKTTDEHWKWWLNSVMTWLPEYSGLESKETLYAINKGNKRTDTLMTNTKFVLDSTALMQDSNEFIIMANWKQILGIDLKFLLYDWRYYVNYVTKITLGHQY